MPAHTVPSRSSNSDATNCLELQLRALGQLAAAPGYKAGKRANPESAVARDEQAVDVFVREMLTRGWLPGDTANAIEAEQAEFRAEPEIPIGCLGHRVDVAQGEPVPDGPRVCAYWLISREGFNAKPQPQPATRIPSTMATRGTLSSAASCLAFRANLRIGPDILGSALVFSGVRILSPCRCVRRLCPSSADRRQYTVTAEANVSKASDQILAGAFSGSVRHPKSGIHRSHD